MYVEMMKQYSQPQSYIFIKEKTSIEKRNSNWVSKRKKKIKAKRYRLSGLCTRLWKKLRPCLFLCLGSDIWVLMDLCGYGGAIPSGLIFILNLFELISKTWQT